MLLLVLLLFEVLIASIESIGDYNIPFQLAWNIQMTPEGVLNATCSTMSRKPLSMKERERYELRYFCPRCLTDSVSKMFWSTDFGPSVALLIPEPNEQDRGNYICWLTDSFLHRNVATMTEKLKKLPSIVPTGTTTSTFAPPQNAYNFSLSWNFIMTSSGLRASCIATEENYNPEDDLFRLDIDCPDPYIFTISGLNVNSFSKTIFIPYPDYKLLGNYTCRLFDKIGGKYLDETTEQLTQIPIEHTTPHPANSTELQPTIQPIPHYNKWLIGAASLFIGFVVVAAIVFMKIRRKNSDVATSETPAISTSKFFVRETNAAYLHEEIRNLHYDRRFEVGEENLERLECIGGGHFGTVFNGNFKVSQQWPSNSMFGRYVLPVAIKVPGDEDGLSNYAACQNILHDELKILCTVGSHPNIVTLIGAITKSNNLCMIVEKCSNGSLLNFLKSKRERFVPLVYSVEEHTTEDVHYSPTTRITKVGINKRSGKLNISMNKAKRSKIPSKELTTGLLLSFSMQVAIGMDHLSSMKCLHRDLAARNVLVTDNLVCKIADFGLAKRTNRKDYYRVETNYDLPVRWMSREAIMDLKFTIESDIWSYGILLYEIFTLGGCPYPTISNSDAIQNIKDGILNEQPEFCPTEIFNHMLKCWDADPEKRPHFSTSAALFHNHLKFASQQVLHNVEKELSRERQRHSKLDSLRSQSQHCKTIRV